MKLTLFNSLTRKREVFTPIDSNLIKMYVCGPTVYDHPHIGNARSVVIYDLLYRILIELYGKEKVKYVRNITDIDDKIIKRASEEDITIENLTKKTTEYFHHDMDYLNCLRPNIEPKATDHVSEMINIIDILLKKNIAYSAHDHVYFDVKKYSDYTKLSGRSLDDMLKEVRIESSKGKRNPEDFVLWKPALETDDPFSKFESPFGLGRPGWHIECSAMSHKYLGETFDIHGGGADLIFPHHTNEIAQTCCAFPGAEFAKTWVHNGFLTVDHEKMSKSLGNFTTVEDLIKTGINGETARLFLLGNHYRKPIDYNKKAITDSEKTLSYWYRAIEDYDQIEIQKKLPKDFIDSLLEDMNISKAVKIINDFAKEIYSTKNENPKKLAASNLVSCARFLGLMNLSSSAWFRSSEDSSHIDVLITQRLEAKQNKNWALADQIRKKLSDMEIEIEDTKDGLTQWRRKN